MLKYIVLLAFLAAVAHGQSFGMGGCPSVNVMKTYDSAKMGGTWYLISRISNSPVDTGKCVSVSLTDLGFGHFATMTYTSTSNIKSTVMGANVFIGTMVPNTPAQYVAIFPTSALPVPIPYSLLNTDYTTYAVAYFCLDLGFANIKTVHVYSRDKTTAGITAATTKANTELDWYKVDRSALVPVDQTCT